MLAAVRTGPVIGGFTSVNISADGSQEMIWNGIFLSLHLLALSVRMGDGRIDVATSTVE